MKLFQVREFKEEKRFPIKVVNIRLGEMID